MNIKLLPYHLPKQELVGLNLHPQTPPAARHR